MVWNIFYFSIYWEFHHPVPTDSYFSEGWLNHQTDCDIVIIHRDHRESVFNQLVPSGIGLGPPGRFKGIPMARRKAHACQKQGLAGVENVWATQQEKHESNHLKIICVVFLLAGKSDSCRSFWFVMSMIIMMIVT